ncbi:hypothetical protein V7168_02480 [Neobacillus drentensis]
MIALSIGAAVGPSQEQIDSANAKVDELKKQLSTKTETVASLETKNKDLQAKVDEAAPWFKKKDDERKQKEAEAEQIQQQITDEKVKEIIEHYSIGENDKLNNVSVENGEVKATIVLAPNELFSAKDMAVNGYIQLSDELLNHGGWQILTVTYANIGSISMNRNEKETNDFGDYFPTLEIEERLK